MAARKSTDIFARVRRLGVALADVQESTSFGAPALKVGGTMFTCIPTNKSAEPDSLLVRLSFTERDLRLSFAPTIYYLKPHYEGYSCVLARVKLLDDDELKELLETSWQFVRSTKATKAKRPRRHRR
ncbi:MAG TPA: MmcQ/YjbR family DNA-binding protein [Gemmatimonadaceae bacterium]|nr:MmcQ/YjbR family DNA-binding protein [Gemmatimonadaceae bacterium]